VVEGACPNLLAEACLYRYPDQNEGDSENPLDEHNHALAALRYLICKVDERQLARGPRGGKAVKGTEAETQEAARILEAKRYRELQRAYLWGNSDCWTNLG
jgi:hypothetical protein